MEVPKFLIEMSEQMNNEDVRMTAEPLWMVCYDKWLTCAEGRGDKEILLLNDNGDYIECENDDHTPIFDYLKEYHETWCMDFIKGFEEDEDDIDELSNYLELEYNTGDLPIGVDIEKIAMQKEMTVVKACLTQDDADFFIRRKQHDYAPLYTYVFSMIHCPQMIELRAWIKSLSN